MPRYEFTAYLSAEGATKQEALEVIDAMVDLVVKCDAQVGIAIDESDPVVLEEAA